MPSGTPRMGQNLTSGTSIPSYLLPANGVATPDMISRKRRMADALMQQGIDTSPVESPWQAAARVAQAGMGGYSDYQAGQQEQEGRKSAQASMAELLQSDSPDNAAIMGAMNNPWLSEGQGRLASMLMEQNYKKKQPDWQTQKAENGDILRWNQNDPNAKPEVFYDAPDQGGGMFDGKSVEAQALNHLIQTGALTQDQAAQIAAGKPITGANGEMLFLTPQDIVRAAQQGGGGQMSGTQGQPQAMPIPQPMQQQAPEGNTSQFDLMTQRGGAPMSPPMAQPQQVGIPLGPSKKTESQIKGEAIEQGARVSAQHLTGGATPENIAPGVDPAGEKWNSAMASVPIVGRWLMTGQGQVAFDDLYNVAQNYTYALSGAQAPDTEVKRNLSLILPRIDDSPEAKQAKKERLIGYIATINNRAQGPGGASPGQAMPQAQAPQQNTGGVIKYDAEGNRIQ